VRGHTLPHTGLLCHLLLLGGRTPSKVLFAKDTGCVFNSELLPSYSERTGVLDSAEAVPFRLTRNLQTFFSSFGVEGIFTMAMANAAQVGRRERRVGGSGTVYYDMVAPSPSPSPSPSHLPYFPFHTRTHIHTHICRPSWPRTPTYSTCWRSSSVMT